MYFQRIQASHGGMFVSLMEGTEWPSSAEGTPKLPVSFSPKELIAFRDDMLNCGPPEEITEDTFFAPGEYLVRYARHKIFAPILNLRIKYGNEVFSDLVLYLSKFAECPTATMMTADGKNRPPPDVPEECYKWWGPLCHDQQSRRADLVRPPNYLLPASLSHRGSSQVLRLRGCTWMREASSRKAVWNLGQKGYRGAARLLFQGFD
jgi:hypothetical protein